MFNDLKELTDTRYPGIPSNATPSTLGDALLLELTNGEYLFAKAVAGRNSLSWLQVNDNGSVTLYVSTLGKDYLKPEVPLLLIRQGKDIYSTIRQAYQVSASASMGYLTSEVLPSTMNCIFSQFIRISSEELLRIIISHWESFGINL